MIFHRNIYLHCADKRIQFAQGKRRRPGRFPLRPWSHQMFPSKSPLIPVAILGVDSSKEGKLSLKAIVSLDISHDV